LPCRQPKNHKRMNRERKPLGNTPLVEIIPASQKIVILDHTCSVEEALNRLSQFGIQSAPVYNSLTNQFLGLVDVMDMATFVVDSASQVGGGDFNECMQRSFSKPVYAIMNASGVDPFLPVPTHVTLGEVLHIFYSQGIHRLPIVDLQNNLVGIASQWDIVTFLNQHQDSPDLVKQMSKTIAQLDLAPGRVVSVSKHASLKECFTAIIGYRISAVAIVDEAGRLVGTISASDLKGITKEKFIPLVIPVEDFLKARHKPGALSCFMHTTLGQVTQVIATTGLHRVFVVDESKKVISVVSLTDILRTLSPHLVVTGP